MSAQATPLLNSQSRQQVHKSFTQQSAEHSFTCSYGNRDLEVISEQESVSNSACQSEPALYEFTEVFVWGDDSHGQLGLFHQKRRSSKQDVKSFKLPKTCSFNITISQVACGELHSAILTTQGHLYMMGSNSHGQLGIGQNCPDFPVKNTAGAPCLVEGLKEAKVVSVACGKNFTFAIIAQQNPLSQQNDQVFGWGCNTNGQLGLPGADQVMSPQVLQYFEQEAITVSSVSCGIEHSLFVTDKGTVYSCGSNKSNQLGIDTSNSQVLSLPTPLSSMDSFNVIQASAGHDHSLFLTQEGEVFVSGSNSQYQLGLQDSSLVTTTPIRLVALKNHNVIKIAASTHSAAVTSEGELFLWGASVFGEYKWPQKILTISNQVTDVSIGSQLGVAVDNKGMVWSWGYNQVGELGVGDTDPRIHPYPILTLKGKLVSQIACGDQFVIALGSNFQKQVPNLRVKSKKTKVSSSNHNSHSKPRSKSKSSTRSVNRSTSHASLRRKDATGPYNQSAFKNNNFESVYSPQNAATRQQSSKKLQRKGSKTHLDIPIPDRPQSAKRISKSKVKVKKAQPNTYISHYNRETPQLASKANTSMLMEAKQSKVISSQFSPANSFIKNKYRQPFMNIELNETQKDFQSEDKPLVNLTNKEKIIKDLAAEVKLHKGEADILRKDTKIHKQAIDLLEKQVEKLKHYAANNNEVVVLHNELKRKELKMSSIKKKKNELKSHKNQLSQALEQVQQERDSVLSERESLRQNLLVVESENQTLQKERHELKKTVEHLSGEIDEFQTAVTSLRKQSQEVEQSLLEKLQEISEKHKEQMQQLEGSQAQEQKLQSRIFDLETQMREQSLHQSTTEQENQFLREEIEKAKFSRNKEEYSKFIAGLSSLKRKQPTGSATSDKIDENKNKKLHAPKIQDENVNYQYQYQQSPLKDSQQQSSHKKGTQEKVSSTKSEARYCDLKTSYNQRLLKSIEKKTLRESSHLRELNKQVLRFPYPLTPFSINNKHRD